MHEIGINPTAQNVHYGTARNPYDHDRDAGGSSSGPAAAVAAGFCPVAIGADGGGSIRVPAALCGVVGLKPTYGRVSEHGAAPLDWSVAHIGPIGASVEDVALSYAVIAGRDGKDPNTYHQPPVAVTDWLFPWLDEKTVGTIRIGIYREWFNHADPEILTANEAMVQKMAEYGAEVKEIDIPELNEMRIAHAVTILSEMAASMKRHDAHWDEFAASTRINLIFGQALSSYDYVQSQRMRARAMSIFARIFEDVDVIVTPTTPIPAPIIPPASHRAGLSDLNTTTELMRYMIPGNLAGLPAITFPIDYTDSGLPISMQAMGRPWAEDTLLRVAHAAENLMERKRPLGYTNVMK
jgi:Asp-tRNA(Asn)/Glu-tRNA(Gln) amidotransferase A subunit family amidase